MFKLSVMLWLLIIGNIVLSLNDAADEEKWLSMPDRRLLYRTQCSRRFTPGVCVTPLAVVWTFVLQIQNCTERMGCASSKRTNRFNTYRRCMRTCSSLAGLYGQYITADDNDSHSMPELTYRRNIEILKGYEDSREEDDEEDDSLEEPAIMSFTEPNDDIRDLADVTVPDIDNAGLDDLPNSEDLFHDVFGRSYKRF